MQLRSYISVLFMLALASLGPGASGTIVQIADVPVEYLSDCKLEHGIVELPHPGSPKSIEAKGYIFNFGKKQLGIDPLTLADKEPNSFEEFRQAIIEAKTGDLYFKNGGDALILMAVSGRIENLGTKFLYESSGKALAEPKEAVYTEEGEKLVGILTDVRVGDCYLMSTLEGNIVLFRLLSLADDQRSCVIQWVKNAPNAEIFEIPKGPILQAKKSRVLNGTVQSRVADRGDTADLPEFAVEPLKGYKKLQEFSKATEVHMANRAKLIQILMDMLKEPEASQADRSDSITTHLGRVLAIRLLGELRAAEAAPLLASMIHIPFGTARYEVTIDNTFGCVPALVKIGKPGAAACLNVITNLAPSQGEWSLSEKLPCIVILRVEGEKVARLVLEDRKNSLTDPQQIENLDRALAEIDNLKSAVVDTAYSQKNQEVIKLRQVAPSGSDSQPSPVTAETGRLSVAYILTGVALAVIGIGLTFVLRKKLRSS